MEKKKIDTFHYYSLNGLNIHHKITLEMEGKSGKEKRERNHIIDGSHVKIKSFSSEILVNSFLRRSTNAAKQIEKQIKIPTAQSLSPVPRIAS